MVLFIIGLFSGAMVGMLIGTAYDHWRIRKIVESTILTYRVEVVKERNERLRNFIDEQKGGAE